MLLNRMLLIISMLIGISMLSILSEKLRISYPICLVISGLILSLVPGIPPIELEPDLVFLIFLPPLLYSAAWNTPWNDFFADIRTISLFAFALVIFTAGAVGIFAAAFIPGFTLTLGFLLGGIVSPSDAIAATSIIGKLNVPRRVFTILEGESLINDASGLIVFRFSLLAIITGHFIFWTAAVDFIYVVMMGVVIGLIIAHIVYAIHRFLPTNSNVDTGISFISPYLMYLAAEQLHCSGVLAVVTGGLFLSFRSPFIFTYSSRLQIMNTWNAIVFLLNGFVFILIGLQLNTIMSSLEEYSISEAIGYGLLISLLIIIIRIVWVFPSFIILKMVNRKRHARVVPLRWEAIFVISWSGMRGVLSLAAALAIPVSLPGGYPFPYRNLILFISFVVILATLVFQGLSLPWIIRTAKVEENEADEELKEQAIRLRLAEVSLNYMDRAYPDLADNDAFKRVRERYERMMEIATRKLEGSGEEDEEPEFLPHYRQMRIDIIAIKRTELIKMRRNREYPEELLRKKELELDLEEARLRKNY